MSPCALPTAHTSARWTNLTFHRTTRATPTTGNHMPHITDASTFLALRDTGLPVLDARSPSEHARGAIPGALNLPVLDDAQREAVGTLYARSGREAAVHLALQLVGPHLSAMLARAQHLCENRHEVLVHCWRGGMRSGSLAWLLESAGYTVHLLEGGYKAYRAHVRAQLARPARVIVLGGMTGTGKTDILHAMADLGCQVVDLEGLANHRGSAFGSIGLGKQPTNEQFEAALYEVWSRLDHGRPIWMEDESSRIGTVAMCDAFFTHIEHGRLVTVELPLEARVARLVAEYAATGETEAMLHGLERIRKRLGDDAWRRCADALRAGDHTTAVRILLRYYDKAYAHHQAQHPREAVRHIVLERDDPATVARRLAADEDSLAG